MTFINMDSVYFYRPPTKAGLPSDGRPIAINTDIPSVGGDGKAPTALGRSYELSGTLRNDDPIEIINTTASSPKNCLSPSHVLVPDLKDTEANAGGKIHHLIFTDGG